VIAVGCGDSGNPASPSAFETGEAGAAAAQASSDYPVNAAFPATPGLTTALHGPGGPLTPADLTNRGWTCFRPPVGDRIVCSRPNQGFPTVAIPPPDDRPATFTFFFFDAAGRFVGTELLIRTDLYNGQKCESTGEPYVFVPFIGYYECVHTTGA
jgi:hypothetical protein